MLLGTLQSIPTLLSIVLFYTLDFALIHRSDKEEISQPRRLLLKF